MYLKDISLYLDVDEYDRGYGGDFEFRPRYLCNFVRRRKVVTRSWPRLSFTAGTRP